MRNAKGQFLPVHGHGHNGKPTPTYYSWVAMKARCFNPKTINFHLYGGRGITVCERWMLFENFLADMGERPDDCSLDRVNNDGNYEPSNCKWSSRCEQQQNTRRNRLLTSQGLTLPMSEWARRCGMSKVVLYGRLKSGWDVDDALTVPVGSVVFPRNEKGRFVCHR